MPNSLTHSIYPATVRTEDRVNFYTQIISKTLDQSFLFIPDGSDYSPDQFCIARWGDSEMEFSQNSFKVYNFSNSIVESW